jgi:hypothetical protein
MFKKIFGPEAMFGKRDDGSLPLLHKGVESVKGIFDYKMSGANGNEPLYFALLNEDAAPAPSTLDIQNAKNQLQQIHARFPDEVKALNNAPLDRVLISLTELKNRMAEKYESAA